MEAEPVTHRCTFCGRSTAEDGSLCVLVHDIGRCGYTVCTRCANPRICLGCGSLWFEAAA